MYRFPLLVALSLAVAALVAVPGAMAGARSKALVSTVNVTAGKPSELAFQLSTKSVKRGVITFKITNKGKLSHDFKLCSKASSSLANSCNGRSTAMISPGKSATLRVTVLVKGTYEYLCTVPGHAAAGMKGLITVT